VAEDDPVRWNAVCPAQFLQHVQRGRARLQVDADRRAGAMMGGGGRFDDVAGVGVEAVIRPGDLDQPGPGSAGS
jgi:hypothetical protein